MNFNEALEIKKQDAQGILDAYLPEEEGLQQILIEAMNYSAMAGGKRLRPLLMKECYRLFGGRDKLIEPFMAAIEMIHNYSLVHDDLPAMDNDELRRGKATTWKKYGEDMAILAGDGLLNYAFETATKAFDMAQTLDDYKRVGKCLKVLSEKAGIYGMIGGQCVDVISENADDVSSETIMFIHKNKTAALIEASMMVGALLAGASSKDVLDIEKAANNIGIAFQIQDDILDIISTDEELGKSVHSDEKNNKTTYVTIHGLEASHKMVRKLSEEAIEIIQDLADENRFDGSFLLTLTQTLINRKN